VHRASTPRWFAFAAVLLCALPAAAAADTPPASANPQHLDIAPADADPPVAAAGDPAPEAEPAVTAASTDQPAMPGDAAGATKLPIGGGADPGAASKPLPSGDGGGSNWPVSTLAALGGVIALILVMRWMYTRATGRSGVSRSRAVEPLSRTSVAPKNHVLLLRVGGRVLVVGDSPGGLRTLAEVTDPDEVAELLASVESDREASLTRTFSRMLQRSDDAFDDAAEAGADTAEHRVDRARDSVSSLLSRVRVLGAKEGAA